MLLHLLVHNNNCVSFHVSLLCELSFFVVVKAQEKRDGGVTGSRLTEMYSRVKL